MISEIIHYQNLCTKLWGKEEEKIQRKIKLEESPWERWKKYLCIGEEAKDQRLKTKFCCKMISFDSSYMSQLHSTQNKRSQLLRHYSTILDWSSRACILIEEKSSKQAPMKSSWSLSTTFVPFIATTKYHMLYP